MPVRVHANTSGTLELTTTFSFASELEEKFAMRTKHLHTMIVTVGDYDSSIIIHRYSKDAIKLGSVATFSPKFEVRLASVDDIDSKGAPLDMFITHRH